MNPRLRLIDHTGGQAGEEKRKTPALTADGLSMTFPMGSDRAIVLENISFRVETGELVCVLGPSGCGKTTLLNIIAGFLAPTGGCVHMFDSPVTGPGPDRCVVFQQDALFPWLTVAENIAFGLKGRFLRSHIRQTVEQYLELVGLGDFADYLPREISGGMKQRVALARVLALNPKMLLMDEPFGALDAQTREEMQQLLLSIRREMSQTIVFVTHDINEAVALADRVMLMSKNPGRIVARIDIPLSHPRTNEMDAFHRYCAMLRRLFSSMLQNPFRKTPLAVSTTHNFGENKR